MAKQRYVNTFFWDDDYICGLDPLGKLLFLYLLTNPLTDIAGAYRINIKRMEFDTGIGADLITEFLDKFEYDGKIIYKDGWVLVCNFLKHQAVNPKVSAGVARSLQSCPQWIKDSLSIAYDSLSYLNLNLNFNSNLNPSGKGENASPDGGSISPPSANEYPKAEISLDASDTRINSTNEINLENRKTNRANSKTDERAKHPAIKMVHEITTRYPHKDLWDKIIREIGENPDTEFFQASYETWRSVNGNPHNLEKWLFDPNKTGKRPEIFGKQESPLPNGNQTNGNSSPKAEEMKSLDEAARLKALRLLEESLSDFGEESLSNYEKFYLPEDWQWLMGHLNGQSEAVRNG